MSILMAADAEFKESVRSEGVTLVDFGAVWCPPCRALLPILEELDQELGAAVSIVKVDVEEAPETAEQFGIQSMPTVVVFKDGQPVEKLVGLRSKEAYRLQVEKYM